MALLQRRFQRLPLRVSHRLNALPVEAVEYLFDVAIVAESLAAVEAELARVEAGEI